MKSNNKHSRTPLFVLTILMLLVTSCVPSAVTTEQPIATIESSATLPVITNTATSLPTSEIVSTPTTQPTTELLLNKECIPIEDKIPDDLVLSGVWVKNRGVPYLETMDGKISYDVPLQGGAMFSTREGDIAISPDGKYLAYIDTYIRDDGKSTDNRILRIIKSSGHSLAMDYWVENWQSIMGWADENTIALLTSGNGIITLNPFTGEWRRFQEPTWAKYYSDYWHLPPYNPTLEWILIRSPEPWILNMINVQTGETVWSRNTFNETTWSADGTTLAVFSSGTIEIIANGKQTAEIDIKSIGIGIGDSIYRTKMSPDNNKTIFTSYPNPNIFIITINQLIISMLCGNDFRISSYPESPIWSPDSRFIILGMYGPNYHEEFDLLIDTQQMKAYKLTSGQYQHRLVWLAEP